tara:strand:- start:5913 stop:6338 length:426 start_codon:yes stop_codon:yes gene_type:complete
MSGANAEDGRLQNYSVDQAAGAVVLVLGAVGGLLLVIWQSACHCKINCCYLFQCERRPPSEEKMASLKDQFKKTQKKEDEILEKEDEILDNVSLTPPSSAPSSSSKRTPRKTIRSHVAPLKDGDAPAGTDDSGDDAFDEVP